MATDDELWPPFGPAAEFREQFARGRGRPDEVHGRTDHARGQARGRGRQGADLRGGPGSRGGHGSRGPGHGDQRGRGRSGLSREEIVDVAIAIADSEGAESVSMRKIAQVLRAGAMSLYWHLAGKEHLLELMLDALMADMVVPEPTGDWQEDLRVQARSQRQVLLRHKWVVDFIAARPPLGPNTLRMLDKSLATLDCLDLDTDTALNILQSMNTYVLGAVVRELGELRVQREQEKWVTSGSDINAKMQQWRSRLEETGMFDHFLRILRDDIDPDAEETREARFDFGLDCVLEGIAAKLAKRAG
jgi:AcrR family transcriptional regulator